MWVRRLVQSWSWLSVILPIFLAIAVLFNPTAMSFTAKDLLMNLAFRNLAFSIVLLVALLTQPKRVVGFLLILLGATDMGELLANLITTGQLTSTVITALVSAVFSFACAYYWMKIAGKETGQKESH